MQLLEPSLLSHANDEAQPERGPQDQPFRVLIA